MVEEGEWPRGGEGEESFSALVLASFEPQDPAELRVDENDTITVFTSPAPEGWCFGEKGGEKGGEAPHVDHGMCRGVRAGAVQEVLVLVRHFPRYERPCWDCTSQLKSYLALQQIKKV